MTVALISSSCSAVDHPLLGLRVAGALRGDLRRAGLDLLQVVVGELDVGCGDVLLEAVQLRRAGDRDDPRLLREDPRERDLRRRRALPLRDPLEQLDERAVRLARLRVEAGNSGAEVGAVEASWSRRSSRSGSPCRAG